MHLVPADPNSNSKRAQKKAARHAARTPAAPPFAGERTVSARPPHPQANKARKGYVPKVYGKKGA